MSKAAATIMKGRMKLRSDYPYAGDVVTYLQPKEDASIGTMGVDRRSRLYYNAEWVELLAFMSALTVLIHEVLHLMLLHPWRYPQCVLDAFRTGIWTEDALIYKESHGIAADAKINMMFHDMKLVEHLPPEGIIPTALGVWTHEFLCFDGSRHTLVLKGIPGKTMEQLTEEVADFLRNLPKPPGGGIGFTEGTAPGHGMWGESPASSEENDGQGESPAEKEAKDKQAMSDWMIRAAGALNSNKSKGTMPADLVRQIEELLTPQIDWRGRLHKFVQPLIQAEYSYRRPRRTSWVLNTILPGKDKDGVKLIAHADTSGSMQKPELEQIAGELYGILNAYDHVEIVFLHSDAGTPAVIDLRSTDKDALIEEVCPNLKGGGGTSHRPVVEWVKENNDEGLKALICFTDGDSDIQHCFNELVGLYRMIVCTRERNLETLAPYCEEIVHLPVKEKKR